VSLAEPDLAASIEAYRQGEFSVEALRALDASRPVRIEPDVVMPLELRKQLVPGGTLGAISCRQLACRRAGTMDAGRSEVRPAGARLSRWRSYIDAVWACDKQASERVQLRFAELENLMPRTPALKS